jgi:hypothetical protein
MAIHKKGAPVPILGCSACVAGASVAEEARRDGAELPVRCTSEHVDEGDGSGYQSSVINALF